MQITANLRTSQIELSVDVASPTEGRPLTRVNWLLRQLADAPDTLQIDALTTRNADARCELFAAARSDPELLLPAEGAPRTYRLSLVSPLGTKRGIGRGGFITSEKLQPWTPPPPKLPTHDAAADEDQPEATDHPQTAERQPSERVTTPRRARLRAGRRLESALASRRYRRRMDLRLLYFNGCPNWREMDERLREAVALAGLTVEPTYVRVETPEDAERLSFHGSPTLLVNGADPFADASAPVGLSCRVFQTPDGLRGAPTLGQLSQVLTLSA